MFSILYIYTKNMFRSSSANAAVAFAVATAGSSNPRDLPQVVYT